MTLSPRERQVLQLVARGYTNRAIARALVVSVKTVESHRDHIRRRLGVRNMAQAVYVAVLGGQLEVE